MPLYSNATRTPYAATVPCTAYQSKGGASQRGQHAAWATSKEAKPNHKHNNERGLIASRWVAHRHPPQQTTFWPSSLPARSDARCGLSLHDEGANEGREHGGADSEVDLRPHGA